MTEPALVERITRSLAFMLRHQPEAFDLEVDAFGWADLGDVVRALNERLGEPVEEEDVYDAVEAGDRVRYEIQGERIRALYGHSIPVEPGDPSKPPEVLYVAIPTRDADRALRFGLRGGRRRFLHLALTKDDAREAGRRAAREYTVLSIEAIDAWEEGINFYDRRALWLAEELPTQLLEVEGEYTDGTDPRPRSRRPDERDEGEERGGRGDGRSRRGDGGRGDRGRGRGRSRDAEERTHAAPPVTVESARSRPSTEAVRSEERPERPAGRERVDGEEPRGRRRRGGRGRGRGREEGEAPRDQPVRAERPLRDEAPLRETPAAPPVAARPVPEDRPRREERPRSDDRPRRDERPRSDDRPRRDDSPRRDERPRRDESPRPAAPAPRADDRGTLAPKPRSVSPAPQARDEDAAPFGAGLEEAPKPRERREARSQPEARQPAARPTDGPAAGPPSGAPAKERDEEDAFGAGL